EKTHLVWLRVQVKFTDGIIPREARCGLVGIDVRAYLYPLNGSLKATGLGLHGKRWPIGGWHRPGNCRPRVKDLRYMVRNVEMSISVRTSLRTRLLRTVDGSASLPLSVSNQAVSKGRYPSWYPLKPNNKVEC